MSECEIAAKGSLILPASSTCNILQVLEGGEGLGTRLVQVWIAKRKMGKVKERVGRGREEEESWEKTMKSSCF